MSNSDNFEAIAEDTMDLLILTIAALTEGDAKERAAVKLIVSLGAQAICHRAIALTA